MRYRITRPRSFYLIVVLPILVFVFSDYGIEAFGYYGFPPEAWKDVDLPDAHGLDALTLRYRFLTFTLAFYVVVVACIAFPLRDLTTRFKGRSRTVIAIGFMLIAVVASIPAFWPVGDGGRHPTNQLIDATLFESALTQMQFESKLFPTFLDFYEFTIDINKVLAIAVVALNITCAVAIACSHPVPPPRSRQPLMSRLHRQSGDFKRYMYLSSLFLVVGILQLQSWLKLPAYVFVDGAQRQAFEALADSIVFYYSMTFSLVIVVFAVPGLLVMRESSQRLVARTLEPGAIDYQQSLISRMKGLGFGLFSVEGMQSVLAVLAPVIAGSLDFTKLLSG